MSSLFKRQGKGPYLIAWVDHTGRRRVKSSRTTDKETAARIARKLEVDAALRREGVIDVRRESIRKESQRSIDDHLTDYTSAMRSRSKARHIEDTQKQIEAICLAANWVNLQDLEPTAINRFADSLRETGKSERTIAKYLQAIKGFTRWAVKHGRLESDPLAVITKPNPESDRRLVRRYLTHEEFYWLDSETRQAGERFGMSGIERALLYATAIQTGLRSNELRSLTRGKLQLTANPPFIIATASSTKNKKLARQYVTHDLASELAELSRAKLAGTPVFRMPQPWDVVEMFRADLADARKAWLGQFLDAKLIVENESSDFLQPIDSDGEHLDFHALRHTTATWLIQAGADVQTVQSVLRHSDIKLTLQRYGHLFPGSEAAAVSRLQSAFGRASRESTGTEGAQRIRQRQGRDSMRLDASVRENRELATKPAVSDDSKKNTGSTKKTSDKTPIRAAGLEPAAYGLKVREEGNDTVDGGDGAQR